MSSRRPVLWGLVLLCSVGAGCADDVDTPHDAGPDTGWAMADGASSSSADGRPDFVDAWPHDAGADGPRRAIDAAPEMPDTGRPTPDARSEPPDVGPPASDAGRPFPDARPDPPDASPAPPDAWVRPPRPRVDRPGADASWRYGGGAGYPDLVDPAWPVTTVVRDREALQRALGDAAPGDIVYVADDAAIDLTGTELCVPEGVWLASGRGRDGSAGGLLYTTETVRRPLVSACGDDVRITGLRILGADPGQCPAEWPDRCTGRDRTGGRNCRDCTPTSIGIRARGVDRLEVDNCELAGWSNAAISLSDAVDVHVHHNHVHHTWRQGLGYGLVLVRGGRGNVRVLVEYNRFHHNRHVVAGTGEPGQDYEARNNLVSPPANGHVFDMHGANENTDNGQPWAGGDIRIHRNSVLVADQYTMVIRGRPRHGAWLYDNCLARRSAEQAARQRHFFGNMHVDRGPDGPAPNRYGQAPGDCERARWCFSAAAVGPWTYLAPSGHGLEALHLADLDGDGVADVFRADGETWWWSRGGRRRWARRNTSSVTEVAFADFDGDGRDDAFRANGRRWQVSDGAAGRWRRLRDATERLPALRFGDFDGDGRADVFTAGEAGWRWSRGGSAPWAQLNGSGVPLDALAFGDFDGDGRTDVFRAHGGEWQIARGGRGRWERLNGSSYGIDALLFADVDGDGRTDVLRAGGDVWYVSWGGATRWARLRIGSERRDEVRLADLDGDGAADLFRTGCR